MLFDDLVNLMRVKQQLSRKYANLSRAAHGKGNRLRFARRSAWYRDQAVSIARRVRLGTFVRSLDRELVPRFPRSVIPIFQEKYHAMESGGTGNLFRIGEQSFLITASHIFEAHELGLGLYVPRFDTKELVQLTGHVLREKTLDVAALGLSAEVAAALEGYTFLTPTDARLKREPLAPGIFYAYGFPRIFSFPSVIEATIRAGAVNIVAQLLTGPAPLALNPEVYMLLHAFANTWDLNGISGCAIWQAYRDGDPWDAWDPSLAKVVAVETGTYWNHTVVEGTRIRHVFRMIAERIPELQPAIQPHL